MKTILTITILCVLLSLTTASCGKDPLSNQMQAAVTVCTATWTKCTGGQTTQCLTFDTTQTVNYRFIGETPQSAPACLSTSVSGVIVTCDTNSPRSVVLTESNGHETSLVFSPSECGLGN